MSTDTNLNNIIVHRVTDSTLISAYIEMNVFSWRVLSCDLEQDIALNKSEDHLRLLRSVLINDTTVMVHGPTIHEFLAWIPDDMGIHQEQGTEVSIAEFAETFMTYHYLVYNTNHYHKVWIAHSFKALNAKVGQAIDDMTHKPITFSQAVKFNQMAYHHNKIPKILGLHDGFLMVESGGCYVGISPEGTSHS